MIRRIRVLFKTLNGYDPKNPVLNNQGQINKRQRFFCKRSVFQYKIFLIKCVDILIVFLFYVINEYGLTVFNTPDWKLIFIGCIPGIRLIPFPFFNRVFIFKLLLLRVINTNAEYSRICKLVDMFLQFMENGFKIQGCCLLFADLA